MRASIVPASLRYIGQVARSGSIQGAARELNIAASAINRQILLLEQDLSVKLFERLPRGMRLTPAGEALVALGHGWLADEQRIAGQLQQLQGLNQGVVRIVAMDSHVNGFLPPFIAGLEAEHPRIALTIEVASTDAAVMALMDGRADLVAAFNLPPRRDLQVIWSAELPFGCVVAPSHPLAQAATTSLQAIAAHPIVLQSKALAIRRYLDARHGWLFDDGRRTIETNSLQLLKILAASGRYAAFTSELDAAAELLAGTLVFVPVRDRGAEPQTIGIAADGRRSLSRAGTTVADALADQVQAQLQAIRALRRDQPD